MELLNSWSFDCETNFIVREIDGQNPFGVLWKSLIPGVKIDPNKIQHFFWGHCYVEVQEWNTEKEGQLFCGGKEGVDYTEENSEDRRIEQDILPEMLKLKKDGFFTELGATVSHGMCGDINHIYGITKERLYIGFLFME